MDPEWREEWLPIRSVLISRTHSPSFHDKCVRRIPTSVMSVFCVKTNRGALATLRATPELTIRPVLGRDSIERHHQS